jgi:hypothetical protein
MTDKKSFSDQSHDYVTGDDSLHVHEAPGR